MKNKETTIDILAGMIKRGFDDTDKKMADGFRETAKGFKDVNAKLDKIENFLLKQHSLKIEYLEKRIHRLEESLAIK